MRETVLPISAIVEALVEAGATPEMILSAVSAAEAHALDVLERRRASDRARQQRRRQRLAREEMEGREGEGLACPRHATAGDSHVTARDFPLPNKERSPAPPKEINPTPNSIDAGSVVARIFPAGPRERASRQADQGTGHPGVGPGEAVYRETEHLGVAGGVAPGVSFGDPRQASGARPAGRGLVGPDPRLPDAPEATARIFPAEAGEGEPRQVGHQGAKSREGRHPEVEHGHRGEDTRRGTRLPDTFVPDWEFAAGKGFGRAAAEAEFEKFRDYWCAKAGREATKLDWQATWRNWIRNAG
ncbi:hypothetical protein EHS39_25615, partial [Ensifer sp. MPMI2T]